MSSATYTDPRYAHGTECTWHGPLAQAVVRRGEPNCPNCRGLLAVAATEDDWWDYVRRLNRAAPGTEAMTRWGKGKCFPDQDTLQNAFRQSTAEEEGQP